MGGALMTSTIDGCCCGEVLRMSASSCERIAEARMWHIVYSQVLKDTHGCSRVLKGTHGYSWVLTGTRHCVYSKERDVVRQADRLLPRDRSHLTAEWHRRSTDFVRKRS